MAVTEREYDCVRRAVVLDLYASTCGKKSGMRNRGGKWSGDWRKDGERVAKGEVSRARVVIRHVRAESGRVIMKYAKEP